MDKVYVDTKDNKILYEEKLNTIEIEISQQEVRDVSHGNIVNYIKDVVKNLIPDK